MIRWFLLPMPLILPLLISEVYEPINRHWTVKLLGCGCPPVDGSWRFNANDFNARLWLGVSVFCGCAYCGIVWRRFRAWRQWMIIVGMQVLVGLCFGMYARGFWL